MEKEIKDLPLVTPRNHEVSTTDVEISSIASPRKQTRASEMRKIDFMVNTGPSTEPRESFIVRRPGFASKVARQRLSSIIQLDDEVVDEFDSDSDLEDSKKAKWDKFCAYMEKRKSSILARKSIFSREKKTMKRKKSIRTVNLSKQQAFPADVRREKVDSATFTKPWIGQRKQIELKSSSSSVTELVERPKTKKTTKPRLEVSRSKHMSQKVISILQKENLLQKQDTNENRKDFFISKEQKLNETSSTKRRIQNLLDSQAWQILTLSGTIFVLFASDLLTAISMPSWFDIYFDIITLALCGIFVIEWILISIAQPREYFLKLYFWLDFVAFMSLLGDVSFIKTTLGLTLARAGRAARAGTRAGRVFKLSRVVRVSRLFRAKAKADKDEQVNSRVIEDEEHAGNIAEEISHQITKKVIVMVLVILVVLPYIEPKTKEFWKEEHLEELQRTHVLYADNMHSPEIVAHFDDSLYSFEARNDPILELFLNGEEIISSNITIREAEKGRAHVTNENGVITSSVVFDERKGTQLGAVYSMFVTTFVTIVLACGAVIWTRDAKLVAHRIAGPLEELCITMDMVSNGNFKIKPPPPSDVYEIAAIHESFWKMQNAIISFSKYMPKQVVRKLLAVGGKARLGVQSIKVSLLMADLTSFREVTSTMSTVTSVDIICQYLAVVSDCITSTRGTLGEFQGGEVLGIWNAPERFRKHEKACCDAAIQIREAFAELKRQWKQYHDDFALVNMKIGVHTAICEVGNIGGSHRMKYGVWGKGVEFCGVIRDMNERLKTTILMSQSVADEVLNTSIEGGLVCMLNGTYTVHEIVDRMKNVHFQRQRTEMMM